MIIIKTYSFLMCVFFVFLLIGCKPKTKVIVSNDSSLDIKNICLFYNGGETFIPLLCSNTKVTTFINPTIESSIQINYTMDDFTTTKTDIDVYIAPSFKSRIFIHLKATNDFSIAQLY